MPGPAVALPEQSRPTYNAGGQLGRNLQELARLIKSDAGIEAAFAEVDGWDHHQNENQSASEPAESVFQCDRGILPGPGRPDGGRGDRDDVRIRPHRRKRTATGGTDHGHGSLMMVLGGPVQGGKIYGEWPGLEKEQLFEGRDLAVTTDFRMVLSELVRGHLGRTDLARSSPDSSRQKYWDFCGRSQRSGFIRQPIRKPTPTR